MGIQAIIPKQKLQDTIVFKTSLFSSEDKLILAPLQNLTNLFFRKTFVHFFPNNFDCAFSPFISATSNCQNINSIVYDDIQPCRNETLIPLVPQILGNNAEQILQCAHIIERLGYREINLNMGCPKKDIVRRNRGAGLLRDTKLVQLIIESLFRDTKLQLSLKVRLGINDSMELRNLVPMLNDYPIKSIIIHPRTQQQQYNGNVDLAEFEYFSANLRHTIVYNGDIFSVDNFVELKNRFPYITHWMIGRGILANPFLCSDIRGITYDKGTMLLSYFKELQQNFIESMHTYRESIVLNKMKEFVKYLALGYRFDVTPLLRENSLEGFNRKFVSVFQ